ncbi:MAG: hypothetical protein MUP81_04145 [Dehalococcoidia bacterium]|nr:hypothetical protein [Dehalococcoidia bacterium]
MAPTLQDYYNGEANYEEWGLFSVTEDYETLSCQTFTANRAYQLTSVKLMLSKSYDIEDFDGYRVIISIKATDGDGKPTGDDLTSETFYQGELEGAYLGYPPFDPNPAAPTEKEITFSSPINLTKDTKYAIVGRNPDSSGGDGWVAWWGKYGGNPYANGQSGGIILPPGLNVWNMSNTNDCWFETYGTYTLNKAINPTPTHNATDVTLHQETITWENGGGATAYDVYYGLTSGSLVKVSSAQAGTSFTVKGATSGSPYGYVISRSWRIDSIGSDTVTGDVWTFTTITFDPVLPTGITIVVTDGVPAATGTATGENNIVTMKRLVAITGNNDLWFETI